LVTTDERAQHSEYEGAAAALEFALWSLDEQLETIKEIDAKSERAITLGIAILAVFPGTLTFQLGSADGVVTIAALTSAVLVAIPFLVAVWLFFHAYAALNLSSARRRTPARRLR
jgi:hypothetical protein